MKHSPGLPVEFTVKMRGLLPADEYDAFLAAFDRPRRVGLRVNTLKLAPDYFSTIAPFSLTLLGDWDPAAFAVTGISRPGRHPYHDAGLYYLQEPSAMLAAALLSAAPGELVLDLAAAPGGKATHLASLMGGPVQPRRSALRRALEAGGLLVANDVHPGRARLLAENLGRWGAANVMVAQDEPERLAARLGPIFDRVLIDAPCSGEGLFRRMENVAWSEAIVAACSRRQRDLLAVAPQLVRPGGRMLYSTCTFSPEENEQVVAAFLADNPDFDLVEPPAIAGADHGRPEWAAADPQIAARLARAIRLWPHRFPGEGHFIALLQRAGTGENNGSPHRLEPRSPTALQHRLWRDFAAATLALDLPPDRLHVHRDRLYLLPRLTLAPRTGAVHVVRYGQLLGELRPGHFRPAHDLALALTDDDASALRWAANDPRLSAYLAGADLPAADLPPGPDGWTLVTVDGFGLGWAKRAAGRLKNHFPHAQRRTNTIDG